MEHLLEPPVDAPDEVWSRAVRHALDPSTPRTDAEALVPDLWTEDPDPTLLPDDDGTTGTWDVIDDGHDVDGSDWRTPSEDGPVWDEPADDQHPGDGPGEDPAGGDDW